MYSRSTRSRWVRETIRIRSRHSRRTLPTQRSACAFARGAAIGARMTLIPSERKISSKPAVNLLSRSRIRMRGRCCWSATVMIRLRACCATQAPFGLAVTLARWTRRRLSSMKKSTCRRRSQSVSTVKKSHSTIPGRLLAQEFPPAHARAPRCGLDAVAVEQVPDAARRQRDPEPAQLAMDPFVSPARVLGRQPQDQLSRLCGPRRPARPSALIRPAAADECPMPAQKCRRLDEERPPSRLRQHLAERRQQGTIGRPQARPADLAPQYLQLMPQHEDLDLLRPLRTTKENEQLEQTADDPVSEGQALKQQTPSTHLSTLSRSKPRRPAPR